MSTINFDQLYQALESGVVSLAQSSLQEYLAQAETDGKQALGGMKSALETWAREAATGMLTYEDLGFLIKAETSLTEMTALKEAGLAQVRIDQFKAGIIDLVIQAVTGIIKI
jgi:hypothetical protein